MNESAAAIKQFQAQLSSQEFYYKFGNDPHNSSAQHLMCTDAETAQKYCPERWKAMNKWLQSARAVSSRLQENEKNHLTKMLSGMNKDFKVARSRARREADHHMTTIPDLNPNPRSSSGN